MAAPTQEYPPWLSVSSSVLTDAAGEPTATLTTVLNLPLTYYGPSIPLGTDGAWVYGGLTSPAPQTSTPTASSPQSTTSAIPSLSSPVVSTASSSASTLTPSSPSTSSASASSTSALPASASSSSGRIPASVIAVVAVVAAIVLFVVLAFLIWLRRQVLRRRADSRLPRQISPFPNDPAYAYDSLLSRNQPVESRRAPGEGSPRGSGEEHDPFLRLSVSPANGFGTRLVHYGPTDPTPASAGYAAPFSRYHDGVQAKEFGISTFAAIKRSLKGKATAPPPDRFTPAPVPRPRSPRSQVSKNIESPSVLSQKLDVALQSPSSPPGGDDDASKPLLGGAITRNTERSRQSRHGSDRSRRSGHASLGDDDVEFGEAHTANRAEYHAVEDQHLSPTQRWAQAVNLPSFTELGRNSWVKRILQGSTTPTRSESRMQSYSRPDSYGDRTTSRVFPADLDLGAEGLHEPLQPPPPAREMGMLDTRPISTGSGKSAGTGGTVFYDARSRPGSVNYSTASTDRWKSHPSPLRSDVPPPAYETTLPLQPPPAARSPTQDVLDMPVPRAISPFATASNATSRSSPPPGLNMPNVWRQSAGTSGNRTSGSGEIRIDVLEDPPPAPPPVWTSLRDAGPEGDRRMTFGGPATAQVTTSNENLYSSSHYPSVHSSPHLHPRDNSSVSGSNSSRQHSQEQSGSSGRAPSTSSHGQYLRSTAICPPLSAVGDRRAARVSDISTSENVPVPVLNSTIGSAGTSASVTTHGSVCDSRTGEVMRFPIVPHTMGLETHTEDRDKESDGFDSWTGPDHYMALRAPSVSESGYAE